MADASMNLSVELCMIISACSRHTYDENEILRLLTTGADINFQDANRSFNTPLHLAIGKLNIDLIKLLLDFHPSLKIRNMHGELPRDLALNLNRFDIVKLLDEHRETSKEIQSATADQNVADKESFDSGVSLEVPSDNYTKAPLSYISTRVEHVLSISKIDPHFKRTSFDMESVKQIYATLDENIFLRPLLKVSKEIKSLEIYFLYDEANDELSNCSSAALKEAVFVCGQVNCATFSATLAHKLLHHAMNHINDNDCKPYRRKQAEKMYRFKKIVTVYKNRTESLNPVVQHVFDLPEALWDAELIACVPYLLAFYTNDLTTLHDITENHKELFDFYYEVVLRDIDDYMVRGNIKRFKARPVEGSSFGKTKAFDPYQESMEEKYGSNYRHNKRNNPDLERICLLM